MGIFKNNQPKDRNYYNNRLRSAWVSMALFIILSVVNIVSAATGGDSYYLFSAAIPYYLVVIGMEICGMLPEEYYLEFYEEIPEFFDSSVFTSLLIVAIAILLVCAVITFFVAKRRSWAIIAALAIVGIDTVATMALALGIIDILFHGWLIYDLVSAYSGIKKLKELPEDDEAITVCMTPEGEITDIEEGEIDLTDTEIVDGEIVTTDKSEADAFSYFTDNGSEE